MPELSREATPQYNFYDVLQISSAASQEVVHAAYRALARHNHPDVNQSADAARQMCRLNAAYAVLSDPERRAKYDAQRVRLGAPRPVHRPVRSMMTPRAAVGAGRLEIAQPEAVNGPIAMRRIAAAVVLLVILGLMIGGFWVIASALDDSPPSLVHTRVLDLILVRPVGFR